jgi:hypothetical protein
MGTVHDLIEVHGKKAAILADVNRREVEAAAAYMADEDSGIGFLYSGWCQAIEGSRMISHGRSVPTVWCCWLSRDGGHPPFPLTKQS